MDVPRKAWNAYIGKLRQISDEAATLMQKFLTVNPPSVGIAAVIEYAQTLTDTYGEAAAALACEMYDAVALAYGVTLPPADPAEPIDPNDIERAIISAANTQPDDIPLIVRREVKRLAANTTLQNAQRDGAEWAWVPNGDTCAFCLTLASRGWQFQSAKAKKAHAEHIHNNCDCNYAVRFNGKGGVAGYDPDKYLQMYRNADGSSPAAKINAMRRDIYAENAEKINAQKRSAYAKKKERESAAAEEANV